MENDFRSGIYQIRNIITDRVYIGRTSCFHKRRRRYVYAFNLLDKKQINSYLLNSMLKYGFNNFRFEILEVCDKLLTPKRELFWILKTKSNQKEFGYNLRLDVDGCMIVDRRTSKKISQRVKEEWESGKRDQHSAKLKVSWLKRDRADQSRRMSRNLTKYKYRLNNRCDVTYRTLKILGLEHSISQFHRNKNNHAFFKGLSIERVLI